MGGAPLPSRGGRKYATPAQPQDFERCNNCREPFARRGAVIDMTAFRRHKQACLERKPLPASRGKRRNAG